MALAGQVGRRLRQEDDREEEEARCRADQSQGVPGQKYPQEVAQEDSQGQEEGREGAELASELRTGALRNVYRSGGHSQAHPQPTDRPPSQHQHLTVRGQVSHADQEEGGEEDEAGEENGVLSAESIE